MSLMFSNLAATKKEKPNKKSIRTRKILITAGPTREPIDPVRFLSNISTGYMGYELARLASRRKTYDITLISGPTDFKPPASVKFIRIETAIQLYKNVHRELKKNDILIMTSAVSDFRPAVVYKKKIKKEKVLTLKLVKNPDILGSISKKERKGKIIIGFALETDNILASARKKLKNKKLDLLIANKLDRQNVPFGKGPKDVYLLDRQGRVKKLKKVTKIFIARAILDTLEQLCYTPN